MTPLPLRCLCSPRAATLCCTNLCARPLLCKHRHRRGLRGAQPQALRCLFFSFFFFLHLEERTVFDSALFMFLLGNKRWLCACVFSCWFFKEMGRKKIPPFPRSFPPLPSFRHLMPPFFLVFVFVFFSPVLFCYESTFLFVILGSPRFLFSVKSPYASSALRLLLPSSRPNGLGGAWPAPFPPRLCSSLSTPAQWREPASGRRPAHLALG